jgi:hypothetical protein
MFLIVFDFLLLDVVELDVTKLGFDYLSQKEDNNFFFIFNIFYINYFFLNFY